MVSVNIKTQKLNSRKICVNFFDAFCESYTNKSEYSQNHVTSTEIYRAAVGHTEIEKVASPPNCCSIFISDLIQPKLECFL